MPGSGQPGNGPLVPPVDDRLDVQEPREHRDGEAGEDREQLARQGDREHGERDAGLLVIGPDPARLRPRTFRKAVKRIRKRCSCLLWVAGEGP